MYAEVLKNNPNHDPSTGEFTSAGSVGDHPKNWIKPDSTEKEIGDKVNAAVASTGLDFGKNKKEGSAEVWGHKVEVKVNEAGEKTVHVNGHEAGQSYDNPKGKLTRELYGIAYGAQREARPATDLQASIAEDYFKSNAKSGNPSMKADFASILKTGGFAIDCK
jgi:hypothetical protein